jgi:hypothetical protein
MQALQSMDETDTSPNGSVHDETEELPTEASTSDSKEMEDEQYR